jgi:ribonuclease HII
MAVLIGIDESGYGPILGPLVVSSVSFRTPDARLKADMWTLLARAVAKKKKHLAGRLLITDSKKAYSKSAGIAHLRRTVLAGFLCLDKIPYAPSTATELLAGLCPQSSSRLSSYPWYENLSRYDLGGDCDDIEIASTVLQNTLAADNMKLLDMTSVCLDVGYYNKMVSAVRNKASVLFTAVSALIKQAFDRTRNDQDLQIIIDRQGGRVRYRKILGRMFPDLELKILRESNSISSYELTGCGKKMRLHFPVQADERFLPVSLASMTSKYVRQILMDSINRYFISHCTQLKPTAGYWKDGLRFIKELDTGHAGVTYDRDKLIRCR